PWQAVECIVGGQDECGAMVAAAGRGAGWSEGDSNEIVAADHGARLPVGIDLDDTAASAIGGHHEEGPIAVEGHALGPAQSGEELLDLAAGIDAPNAVVARGAGTGHIEEIVRSECQVVGGDAGLERGEDKGIALAVNFEDGAAAVANVQIAAAIKCNSGGDA